MNLKNNVWKYKILVFSAYKFNLFEKLSFQDEGGQI